MLVKPNRIQFYVTVMCAQLHTVYVKALAIQCGFKEVSVSIQSPRIPGFIMCADQTEQQKDPWLWRLLVDKSQQGFGVGTFALTSVIERYRELGMQRVLTAWHPGEGNAGDFYKRFGFVETGEKIDDEIVAELKL